MFLQVVYIIDKAQNRTSVKKEEQELEVRFGCQRINAYARHTSAFILFFDTNIVMI
jgi:hypothetical protein